MARIPLAAQLYTVRDLCLEDFAATAREVRRIGYPAVELAGYGNLKTAAEARKALDDAGLSVAGSMSPIEAFENEITRVLDDAQTLGTRIVIVPWISPERRKDWRQLGQALSRCAAAAEARAMSFAYHNHSFEFAKVDGKSDFDILFESAAMNVQAELDVYWLAHGGVDPAAWIRKMGPRVLSLHLKDMASGPEQRYAPVGTGILDFPAIIEAAAQAGARYGAVEQDETFGVPPLEALRISLENLKATGFV